MKPVRMKAEAMESLAATRPAAGARLLGAAMAALCIMAAPGCALMFDAVAGAQANECNRQPDARAQMECRERVNRTAEAARAERATAK